MSSYVDNNCERLTESYAVVIRHLKELRIPYVPARGSLFSWLDLSELLVEHTAAAEHDLWLDLYRSAGVLLTPGEGFGHSKKGLFRLVYPCVSKHDLGTAMDRLSGFVLKKRQDES
jgi:1-aminocyclopropane-1-carboxylate synthase